MSGKSQELYEQIEAYLSGELTAEARADFELQLAADPGLREEVELHREIAQAIHDPELQAFKATLKEVDAKAAGETSGTTEKEQPHGKQSYGKQPNGRERQLNPPRLRQFLMAAAAIAGLWLLSTLVWQTSQGTNYSAMIDSELNKVETPAPPRSNLTEIEKQAIEAYAHFEAGEFQEAYQKLQAVSAQDPENMDAAFFAGLVAHRDGDAMTEPLIPLLAVVAQGKSVWWEEASWIAALIYLERDEPVPAKTLLTELSLAESNGIYPKKARKLLRKIQ